MIGAERQLGSPQSGRRAVSGPSCGLFDTRAEVREQMKSMGAEFLEVNIKEDGAGFGWLREDDEVRSSSPLRMALFAKQAKDVDIIITTALVPVEGCAPVLITEEMRPAAAGTAR